MRESSSITQSVRPEQREEVLNDAVGISVRPEQREEVLNDAAGILVRPEQREEVLNDAVGILVRFCAWRFLALMKKSSFLEAPLI
ncbi:MAG: hypothetical protein GXP21_00920 [Gammaproteobacteria bacterium]|nr:hypothetical protein [Gammaproteobacteria bacterium]